MPMIAAKPITPPTTPPAIAPVCDPDFDPLCGVAVAVVGMTLEAVRGAAEAVVPKYTDRSRAAKPAAGAVAVACPSTLDLCKLEDSTVVREVLTCHPQERRCCQVLCILSCCPESRATIHLLQ
jgi:hypothetical protein